jgi:DNA-binding GntR family transcriptional regulator
MTALAQRPTAVVGLASLEHWAYTQIKASIISLALPPASTLVESQLAEQLGVSKTPLRAALLKLEREGFVVSVPYKGSYVAPITLESLRHFHELRIAIEGHAIYMAATTFTDEDLAGLETLLTSQRAADGSGDYAESSRLEDQFHTLFIEHLDNPHFTEIGGEIRDHRQRLRSAMTGRNPDVLSYHSSHWEILAALREHDGARAHDIFMESVRRYGALIEQVAARGGLTHIGIEPPSSETKVAAPSGSGLRPSS